MTTPKQLSEVEPGLTFAQSQEIDKYLEDYRKNPSNSNKYRIGLHAYVNELLAAHTKATREQVVAEIRGKLPKSAPEGGVFEDGFASALRHVNSILVEVEQ